MRLLVATVLLATVAAGCSGGKADTRPVVLGLINMEDAPQGSFTELRRDAEAAVRYVNEQLGGVAKRPLQLETCVTNGTDESSAACATQLVAKGPVAVLGGVDLGTTGSMPVLEGAGVPYVGLTPGLGDELTSQSAFMLAGGITADLLAEIEYITSTLKATRVAVVHQDLPGLQDAAVLAAQAILRQRGVTDLKTVPVKAGVTDLAPAVRAATADNPDVLMAVFPAAGCRQVLDAARAARLKARLFLPSSCLDGQVLPAAEGAVLASTLVPYSFSGDPDVAVYLAHRAGAGTDAPPSALGQAGFALVMDVYRQLSQKGKPVPLPAAFADRLRTARDAPSFMGHPYTCNGQVITITPSVCSASVRLVQVVDGQLRDLADGQWATGAPLVKLLTG